MPEFVLKFSTPSQEAFDAALNGLTEFYGGYRENVVDPSWQRQEGQPDIPVIIPNPVSKEDFLRGKIMEELSSRVVSHNAKKAAEASLRAAQGAIIAAAASFSVSS